MVLVLPNQELQVHIRKVLNEDVNTRNRDLETIKEWLRKQPHLPDTWDEQRLMNFLRGCNFSLEKCKRKLDMYFTMRAAVPEFFKNRDISRPELQEIWKISDSVVLPGLTPAGMRVSIGAACSTDFETPDMADFFKLTFMVGDIRLGAEKFGVTGDVYILDASVGLSKHFFKVSPSTIKKFLVCCQEAYPVKIKEVHVINGTPFLDFIVNTIKPFLKEKIRNRIYIHSSLESLHEYVPKDILPEEYGGTAGKLKDFKAAWLKILQEYTMWFKEEEKIVANESRRLGKPTTYEELFGLDGSFRQLTID